MPVQAGNVAGRPSVRALTDVQRAAEDLVGQFELGPLLDRTLRRALELLDAGSGYLCGVERSTGRLRAEASWNCAVAVEDSVLLPAELVAGMVAGGQPVLLRPGPGTPGVLAAPIPWRGDIVGACVLFGTGDRAFDEQDAGRLSSFIGHAAVAISTARLFAEADARARAEATAQERDRLMREVHGTVTRGLAGVLAQLAAAQLTAERSSLDPSGIREAIAMADAAVDDVRRTVLGLIPASLSGRSLYDALELELDWVKRSGLLDGQLVTSGEPIPLPDETARQLFRIAQQVLSNAVQHSDASFVRVGLIYDPVAVTLLIQDDGRGFALDQVASPASARARTGLGLPDISTRVRAINGSVDVESMPGWGTRVQVRVPVSAASLPATLDSVRGRPRVLVVAGRELNRAGLVRLLSTGPQAVAVVAECRDSAEACLSFDLFEPDLAVVDLTSDSGLAAIAGILELDPAAVVVAVADLASEPSIEAALSHGAVGCVSSAADSGELSRVVLAAARREADPALVVRPRSRPPAHGNAARLTERERQVRALLETGLPDKQIAARLGVSVKTIEKHVGAVLRKTGVRNRTELAALMRHPEHGW